MSSLKEADSSDVNTIQKFRIHDGYRLEQARVPEDMRVAPRRQSPVAGAGFANTPPSHYTPRSPTRIRLRFDDRSIFVGNLPCSVNEQRIREHFGRFGLIFNVVLCLKQSSMDRKFSSLHLGEERLLTEQSRNSHSILLCRVFYSW